MARSIEQKLSPIPLSTGINQAGGTRGAIPGSLEYVINGRIPAAGRLERRCGTTAISALSKGGGSARAYADSAAIPRPTERPSFITSSGGTKLKGTTAGDLYAYDGTFDEFRGCFSASRPVRRSTAIAGPSYIYTMALFTPAVAVTSTGYKLVAAATTSRTEAAWVILAPDGTTIYRGEGLAIATDTWPRAVAQGTKLILVYQVGTAVTAISHETSTGVVVASSATTVLTLAGAASIYWDVSSYNANQWYVAGRVGLGVSVNVGIVDGVTPGTTTSVATTGEVRLSLWADATNSQVWLGYIDDPGGTIAAGFTTLNAALTSTVYAKTTIAGSPGITSVGLPPLFGPRYALSSSDAFYVFLTGSGTAAITRYGYIVAGAVSPATPKSAFHVIPVSKPDAQQRFWALVEPVADTPGQYLLLRYAEPASSNSPTLTIDLSTPLDLGHYENLPATHTFHAVAVQSETAGDSAFFAVPQVLQTIATSGAAGIEPVVSVVLYEYRRYNQEPIVDFDVLDDGEVVIAGQPTTTIGVGAHAGNLSYYGGVGAVELGFPLIPAIYTATAAAGTSSWLFNTIHQWVDARGQRHISSPSATITVANGSGTVTVTASDCTIGQRQVADSQRAHTILFRSVDGGVIPQMSEQASAPTATGIISWGSADSDSELGQNEFLPTAGGVLPVRLAPACRYIRAAEDRLWCGGLWDRGIIEASRIKVPGEPYNFTQDPSHQVVLPGECTGLAYQDGQIVAFTLGGIYLVGGDGPNDQGAGAFLPVRTYVHGLGCDESESASILETELGIIFRSPSSWWLIPRGFGAPIDIGGAIQNESTHCIASAITETANYRMARFLVAGAGEYSSGTVLSFDLMNQMWSRDVYAGAAFGTIGAWPDGLALATYSLSRTAGGGVASVVWAEDEDVLTDEANLSGGTPGYISMSLRTNWQYPFGDAAGWGKVNRVQLAAEPTDSTGGLTLAITVETDSSSYAPSAWTLPTGADPLYREVVVKNPHCTCYRVTVAVAQTTGPAAGGLRLLTLTSELEPLAMIRPVTDSERA